MPGPEAIPSVPALPEQGPAESDGGGLPWPTPRETSPRPSAKDRSVHQSAAGDSAATGEPHGTGPRLPRSPLKLDRSSGAPGVLRATLAGDEMRRVWARQH